MDCRKGEKRREGRESASGFVRHSVSLVDFGFREGGLWNGREKLYFLRCHSASSVRIERRWQEGREEGREGEKRREGGGAGRGNVEERRTVVPDKSHSAGSHIIKMLVPRRDLPRGFVLVDGVVALALEDAGSRGSSSASL